MVVDDLNVESIMSFPPKADAPLIVDSNAMLSDAFPLQGLCALFNILSFLRATRWMSCGSLRETSPPQIRSVSAQ